MHRGGSRDEKGQGGCVGRGWQKSRKKMRSEGMKGQKFKSSSGLKRLGQEEVNGSGQRSRSVLVGGRWGSKCREPRAHQSPGGHQHS